MKNTRQSIATAHKQEAKESIYRRQSSLIFRITVSKNNKLMKWLPAASDINLRETCDPS